jgi:thiamine pyrophosphate-dependent acetolactate synthase large subunit-like protein
MADAIRVLERNGDLSVVICGVYFDESRMHDLLRCVRSRFSKVPFVCVRVLDAELPRVARDAIEIAARTLGAAAFVDFPDLVAQRGEKEAEEELRRAVLAQAKGMRTEEPTVARHN